MASVAEMKKRVGEVREQLFRLNLGASPEASNLRAVLVGLCSALLGDEIEHDALETSGAKYPAPTMLAAAAPAAGPIAQKPAIAPFQAGQEPQRARTAEEATKTARARAARGESTPIGATAVRPNPANPPPPGTPNGAPVLPIRPGLEPTARELAAAHPAPQARPDPTVPDPAGENFLANLADKVDDEADGDQAG